MNCIFIVPKKLVILFALFASTACSDPPAFLAYHREDASSAIVGGQATQEHRAVGLVINASSGQKQQSLCSGAIIGPHTVLTAAHCILTRNAAGKALASIAPSASLLFHVGSDMGDIGPRSLHIVHEVIVAGSEQVPFSAAQLLETHDSNKPFPGDLAILHVVPGFSEAPLLIATTAPGLGDTITLVGYGTTNSIRGDGIGTRRQTPSVVTEVLQSGIFKAGSVEHGICAGDCGGPAMRNGVLTGVSQNAAIGADGTCMGDNTFVATSVWSSFIQTHTY